MADSLDAVADALAEDHQLLTENQAKREEFTASVCRKLRELADEIEASAETLEYHHEIALGGVHGIVQRIRRFNDVE